MSDEQRVFNTYLPDNGGMWRGLSTHSSSLMAYS